MSYAMSVGGTYEGMENKNWPLMTLEVVLYNVRHDKYGGDNMILKTSEVYVISGV